MFKPSPVAGESVSRDALLPLAALRARPRASSKRDLDSLHDGIQHGHVEKDGDGENRQDAEPEKPERHVDDPVERVEPPTRARRRTTGRIGPRGHDPGASYHPPPAAAARCSPRSRPRDPTRRLTPRRGGCYAPAPSVPSPWRQCMATSGRMQAKVARLKKKIADKGKSLAADKQRVL